MRACLATMPEMARLSGAAAVVLLIVFAHGCGSYADFTLPAPAGSAQNVSYTVEEAAAGPVLERGAPGEWDGVDVLNPSVARHNGDYYNLYSGFDGRTWYTGLATSSDGITWKRQGRVLSPSPGTWEGDYIAANGSVLPVNEELLYWYQGGSPPRIGLARSHDARKWRKEPNPVLGLGPRGSWDERGVADPYVASFGGKLYLFYLGQDRAHRQRLGVAVSTDGLRWTRLGSNPVLELGEPGAFDEEGLGEPAVWSASGWYWMLYTGRDRAEHRNIGLARSRDGVHWERVRKTPIFTGRSAWNSQVVCDPTVEVLPNAVRVWYGGGDLPRPDERIHGQIGLFLLKAGS